jgi:hypothetical protein
MPRPRIIEKQENLAVSGRKIIDRIREIQYEQRNFLIIFERRRR